MLLADSRTLGERCQALLAVERVNGRAVRGRTELQIQPCERGLEQGWRIAAEGRLRQPAPAAHPLVPGAAERLAAQGVHTQFRAEAFRLLSQQWTPLADARRRIAAQLQRWAGPREGSLLAALVLGSAQVSVPLELRDAFRVAGLSHALAASGFHLSVLLGTTLALVRSLPVAVRLGGGGLAAIVIGGVSAVELLSGGINLPVGNEVSREIWWRGVDSLLMQPNWRLVAICLLHVSSLATLLAWSLIERDHQRLPGGWWLGSLILLLALQMVAPWLQPIGPQFLGDWLDRLATGPPPAWQAAGLAGLTAILAGGLLGVVLKKLQLTGNLAGQGLALVGGLCGWQAIVTTAVLWIAVTVLRRVVATGTGWKLPSERDDWLATPRLLLADLVVALTLQLLTWRWLDGFSRGLLGRLLLILQW